MLIKIIMMCKNEDDLIHPWITYHGELFGYQNLYVFDNGSFTTKSLEGLAFAESVGVNVRRDKIASDDFVHKGRVFADLISHFDADEPADFYFPLDCDEFICVEHEPYKLSYDRDQIEAFLKMHLGFKGALMISACYDNSPKRPSAFLRSPGQRKTFFAQGACRMLDHGFHCGEGVERDARTKTSIAYMHFHCKPFDQLVFHSKQKIRPFVTDFGPEALDGGLEGLKKYRDEQRPGFHLIGHLLHANEEAFLQSFHDDFYMEMPKFSQALAGMKIPVPFSK